MKKVETLKMITDGMFKDRLQQSQILKILLELPLKIVTLLNAKR